MLWITVAPFFKSHTSDWITSHLAPDTDHHFTYVPATYDHDRSRAATSGRQWADYFKHAFRAWFSVAPWRRSVGYISAFPQLPLMLGLIKRLTGSRRPIVAWMFNLGRTYDGTKGKVARFALKSVDIFIVHSRVEIDTYSSWLGLSRDRFIFVPLAIRTLARDIPQDDESPFLFAMGSANRDYELLFRAAERLGHRTVVVAGPHAVKGLRKPDNVEILSGLSLQECHQLSQRARVNVIPVANMVTASGQVTLLETMMYGSAVVATRCVGTEDYVDHGRTALLVEPGDLEQLSTAIEQLWHNPGLRERLGQAGQAYVLEQASLQGVSRTMRPLLDQLAGPQHSTL